MVCPSDRRQGTLADHSIQVRIAPRATVGRVADANRGSDCFVRSVPDRDGPDDQSYRGADRDTLTHVVAAEPMRAPIAIPMTVHMPMVIFVPPRFDIPSSRARGVYLFRLRGTHFTAQSHLRMPNIDIHPRPASRTQPGGRPDPKSDALLDGIPGVVWEAYGHPDAEHQSSTSFRRRSRPCSATPWRSG
jgi:hypothetical protein